MNKEQFIKLLQNPAELNSASVAGLEELAKRFPYSSSVHVLLTLNLFKEESVMYNASLKTTAVYAGNRQVLKQHVDRLTRPVKQSETQAEELPESPEEVAVETPEESGETPRPVVKSKKELLEEFIKKAPTITRRKESFYNPVEAATRSIVDQEEIVSETLATIYMDQGYYDKALKIYQKLSLKYPEKSIYFAALIEKAKRELKSE